MAIIHLLKNYNNYYNRQLKKRENLEDYIDDEEIYITSIGSEERPVNFDIKDGLLTEAIFNYNIEMPTPDYALVEVGDSFSRWFVIECKQTRGLQHKAILKRDVIAEWYEVIKESPCIIQKGYVGNDSVLVFNKEQQNYNKVKNKELLIKDTTGMGYVVGFIDREKDHTSYIDASYKGALEIDFDYATLSGHIKDFMAIGSATPNQKAKRIKENSIDNICSSMKFGIDWINTAGGIGAPDGELDSGQVYATTSTHGRVDFSNTPSTGDIVSQNATLTITEYYPNSPTPPYPNCCVKTNISGLPTRQQTRDFMKEYATKWKNKLLDLSMSYWYTYLDLDYSDMNDILPYVGQVCEISGVYYKVELATSNQENKSMIASNSPFPNSFRTALVESLPTNQEVQSMTAGSVNPSYYANLTPSDTTTTDFIIYYKTEDIHLRLVQQNINIWTVVTSKTNRNHLVDAPYDMFVIPYGDDNITYKYMNVDYHPDKRMALNLAIEMCRSLGTGASYDIQIVPYCPIRNEGTIADEVDFSLCNCELIYSGTNHDNTDTIIGVYMWAEKSSDSFKLEESREDLTLVNSELTYKEITQMNQYLLNSPDKASQWEFNPAMNKGVKNWEIAFDYRPFSSYVRIQPEWDYLYGTTETDMRGLIFNGAYSITQLSDEWQNYVANNKNYQAIFDTQISTQIKQYDIQNKAAWDTLIPRSIGWGFIGPAMKTYYNIKEQEMQEQLQGISLDSQRKIFEYQLDNIQNQPTTISKLTSINTDFRIYPFVEIYTGTDTDIKNFRNNIKWNGMSIMCVGKIEEYLEAGTETYIQATLLRYNHFIEIENDFTAVQEINAELNKGVYITKEV